MGDEIAKNFGIEPLKRQLETVITDSKDDINHAKTNMRELIQMGKNSLEDLLDVAQQSQHPRAYEVAANFIKILVDANKELADLNIKDTESKKDINNDNRQVHNHMYIGSTSDLLKLLKGKPEEDNVIEGEYDE